MKMMVPATKMTVMVVVMVVVVTVMVIVLMIMKVVMMVVMVMMVDAIMTMFFVLIINTTGIASSDFSKGARIQETDIGPISKSSQFEAKINPG